MNSYKVPLHKVEGNLHKAVYIGIRIQTYTDHYTGLIRVLQYTSVYLSVHTMYTGSLYLRIHAISCSERKGEKEKNVK